MGFTSDGGAQGAQADARIEDAHQDYFGLRSSSLRLREMHAVWRRPCLATSHREKDGFGP